MQEPINLIDLIIPVKNGGETFVSCVEGWIFQTVPNEWQFRIIIVDDGSSDGMPQLLQKRYPGKIVTITHDKSLGRGAACNSGVNFSNATFIGIFDADCLPDSKETLAKYICKITPKVDLIFGSLEALEDGFWGKYYNQVTSRRAKAFLAGNQYAMTTQNCLIRKEKYQSINGFNLNYTKYGFEDRDLLIRLYEQNCNFIYEENAKVLHCDYLKLEPICKKMYEAGKFTAGIFMASHLKVYKRMPFFWLDSEQHRYLRPFAMLFDRFKNQLLHVGNYIIRTRLPYFVKSCTVKILSGIFFMLGSSARTFDNKLAKTIS